MLINTDLLFEKFQRKIDYTSLEFKRSLLDEIQWDARLIGIRGARGVGKTTLLLQHIKKSFKSTQKVLFVSLDTIWFSDNSLSDLIDTFVKEGGTHIFLDEVHKYPDWARTLKNMYDDYPELHIVFTGSSLLEILNARADLSRRAVIYTLNGLSFREYLEFTTDQSFQRYSLEEVLESHTDISREIVQSIKPLEHFNTYLKSGYYPFFKEIPELYHNRVEEVLNMILEIELPLLRGVDIGYTPKLKQLLMVIAESAPFVPNISKLSERIGINRITLLTYLNYLQEAGILNNLYKESKGITRLQKPDKVFLENPNLMFTFRGVSVNEGNVRETFFLNQLAYRHSVSYPIDGDFLVDESWLFEVGGKNKTIRKTDSDSDKMLYYALDGIEYGQKNRIPLWLFGFLY